MRFQHATIPLLLSLANSAASQTLPTRPLSIDDVLNARRIDRASLSPNGEWAAVVVGRPARPDEAYGRTSYDVDSSRGDVWLISTRTGERRALTDGASRAAGYWCATWSPDGERLAMLSTASKGREPRGGDAVRLYVWERRSNRVIRASDASVMAQSRYGSPIDVSDLRGGADGSTLAHRCTGGVVAENAPFLWLDDHRLLVATLPDGEAAAAVDHYARVARSVGEDAARLRAGRLSTGRAVASGQARAPLGGASSRASLRVIDVTTRASRTVATVPAYPFGGALTASVSPDGTRIAVLATLGALRPDAAREIPNSYDAMWTVERRLGFADLAKRGAVRWTALPPIAGYPLDLIEWSPDSGSIAFRARSSGFATETPLFSAELADGIVRQLGTVSVGRAGASVTTPRPVTALWLTPERILAQNTAGGWRVFGPSGIDLPVTAANGAVPDTFVRGGDGRVTGIAGRTLLRIEPTGRLLPVRQLDHDSSFGWPADAGQPLRRRQLFANAGGWALQTIDTVSGETGAIVPPPPGPPDDVSLAGGQMLQTEVGRNGTTLRAFGLGNGKPRDLLTLNTGLRNVAWGEKRLIDYRSAAGEPLKAAVILPPGYRSGQRYPTLVWVYGGMFIRSLDGNFVTDDFMPGFFNLQLYAAKGYVVLVPSMPLPQVDGRNDTYRQIPSGVMPAIDALVTAGIADPDRLGVFGQSFGGYSVYALLGQTNRFKAGVAIAGITDLRSNYGTFDPTARGYPEIAHEKSANWAIRQGTDAVAPWQSPEEYARNSPIAYVDKVTTPLLMLHGDQDQRGDVTQAEQFFYGLYRQGKTAELVRYGGESHSISLSPANIRDVFDRTIAWFDRYVRRDTIR